MLVLAAFARGDALLAVEVDGDGLLLLLLVIKGPEEASGELLKSRYRITYQAILLPSKIQLGPVAA